MLVFYSIVVLLIALLPVALFFRNISLFSLACRDESLIQAVASIPLSVLVPARNEASSIGPALESILGSKHQNFELLVLDDHSEDETAAIVSGYATRDPRVRLLQSQPLPDGWNGKQHACWQLANHSKYESLLFLDADVRLSTDALDRCLAEQRFRQSPLISGFPKQETGTIAEKLLIPLMHYVLLGYLPIDQMRAQLGVGLAAGCGQLFLAEKGAYFAAGGHEAIRSSRHDGIQLPRAFRKALMKTDIFDATDIARCRMYTSTQQVTQGLLKNATEGIANLRLIVPFTILLIGGSVLPGLSLLFLHPSSIFWWILLVSFVISMIPRFLACSRFKQSWLGAVLHPLGILGFVTLQWVALIRKQLGYTTRWRGRA